MFEVLELELRIFRHFIYLGMRTCHGQVLIIHSQEYGIVRRMGWYGEKNEPRFSFFVFLVTMPFTIEP
jgi:hypothetical protein